MIKELETGGRAFPQHGFEKGIATSTGGMTARTYAAISLRVPMSEHDWLNEMIRESQRHELAKAAMQGLLAQSVGTAFTSKQEDGAEFAYAMADATLTEQKTRNG